MSSPNNNNRNFRFEHRNKFLSMYGYDINKTSQGFYFYVKDNNISEISNHRQMFEHLENHDVFEMYIDLKKPDNFILLKHSTTGTAVDPYFFQIDIPKDNVMEQMHQHNVPSVKDENFFKVFKYVITERIAPKVLKEDFVEKYKSILKDNTELTYTKNNIRSQLISPNKEITNFILSFKTRLSLNNAYQVLLSKIEEGKSNLFLQDEDLFLEQIRIDFEKIITEEFQNNKQRDSIIDYISQNHDQEITLDYK